MDFFKLILSDDEPKSPKNDLINDQPSSSTPNSAAGASGWSFGGLIKTLATQSESVIEIYRRDLKEFGSGLRNETEAFCEVASRAVKDLPAEIDGVLKSTAEIISHGTESFLPTAPSEPEPVPGKLSSRRYSRFEVQLRAIESDVSTYCEAPEDSEDFDKWKLGFVLKREENGTIEGIYKRVVPSLVDDETFWCRYFYKVHKLKQQEDARANLVKRAISVDLDDELSWDVDDEDEVDSVVMKEPIKNMDSAGEIEKKGENVDKETTSENKEPVQNKEWASEIDKKGEYIDNETTSEIKEHVENKGLASKIEEKDENESNLAKEVDKGSTSETPKKEEVLDEEKIVEVDTKGDNGGSCKDSDVSIVSTQQSFPEEEDMGWDEIEDVGSGDEKKAATLLGSPSRADLRKRISVAGEDEDLSWDIEDDDEPVTKPGAK